jgi:hypothetical protein
MELPFRGFLAQDGKVTNSEWLFVTAVHRHGKKGIFFSNMN